MPYFLLDLNWSKFTIEILYFSELFKGSYLYQGGSKREKKGVYF